MAQETLGRGEDCLGDVLAESHEAGGDPPALGAGTQVALERGGDLVNLAKGGVSEPRGSAK
jgi:hypothetical protein